jgi:hypothetical protein
MDFEVEDADADDEVEEMVWEVDERDIQENLSLTSDSSPTS